MEFLAYKNPDREFHTQETGDSTFETIDKGESIDPPEMVAMFKFRQDLRATLADLGTDPEQWLANASRVLNEAKRAGKKAGLDVVPPDPLLAFNEGEVKRKALKLKTNTASGSSTTQ